MTSAISKYKLPNASPLRPTSRRMSASGSARMAASCCCAANRWPTAALSRSILDITEQRYKNLTEHQNIQLEERVRRRTAQLENANANLRRASEENARIAAALGRSEERPAADQRHHPELIGYVDSNEVYWARQQGLFRLVWPPRRRRHRPRRARRHRPACSMGGAELGNS